METTATATATATTGQAELNVAAVEWVAALRATNVGQGRSYLRQIDYTGAPLFCCLGIACDISGLGEWGGPEDGDGPCAFHVGVDYVYSFDEDGPTGSLPAKVMIDVGLRTRLGDFLVTEDWLAEFRTARPGTWSRLTEYLSEGRWLPGSFRAKFPSEGVIGAAALSALNDWGMTFAEIADIIESQPLGLFGPPDPADVGDGDGGY